MSFSLYNKTYESVSNENIKEKKRTEQEHVTEQTRFQDAKLVCMWNLIVKDICITTLRAIAPNAIQISMNTRTRTRGYTHIQQSHEHILYEYAKKKRYKFC